MNQDFIAYTKSLLSDLPDDNAFSANDVNITDTRSVEHSHTISVNFSPTEAAYLFTGLGEVIWTENWKPDLIRGDGFSRNDIFLNKASGDTLFVVTNFDVEGGHISYVRLAPQKTVGTIDLQLKQEGQGSRVTITYRLTALSKEAEADLNALSAEAYRTEMETRESNIAAMESEIEKWLHHAQSNMMQPK
ncbi:hypothetical protein [Enterovibrio coralii]|uniref:Uncharacterized protein n=1 Tax=Enterovibrio coralii TaxID=294935 RepID=A0A135I544_9GAMM|nr:hypothetical protein [Enterovibrio coralii]KXF80552.1 hypothetical protein ATN88_07670 [Enterovibrio coralii]